ncbi:MAG: A/G-specific adenine glycosylase [Verrucomicrobiales bacterium]|nr:A/G-specific adenine glycosylase [Verrucomicrobiales bacterium]
MSEKPPQTVDPLALPAAFQRSLIEWFDAGGRDYPWRRTSDPYAILVSEIMLQQTQIATVLGRGYYQRWLERFPDVHTLAAAPEADLLKHWEGLGYYNRARNLQKAARAVVEQHGGRFPETLEGLQSLPGVGRYTAGAVLSFAWDRPAPIVDGNVARVFARLFDLREPVDTPASKDQLWQWADALLPESRAKAYNSALMELGQRLCTKAAPACVDCPVAHCCATREPASLPVKSAARATVAVTERAWLAVRDGRILLEQESGSRRQGLWRLPLADPGEPPGPVLTKLKYGITHHRVDLIVQGWIGDPTGLDRRSDPVSSAGERRWFDIAEELPAVAMPSPYRRAVEAALRDGGDFRLGE